MCPLILDFIFIAMYLKLNEAVAPASYNLVISLPNNFDFHQSKVTSTLFLVATCFTRYTDLQSK